MAIHDRTTFAHVPTLASQVGYIVEGWTYIERVLRDVILYASPPGTDADLVASRLFHMGDLGNEIRVARAVLDSDLSPRAEQLRDILDRAAALLPDRNSIIHGWFAGRGDKFGVELHHFGRLPKGSDRSIMTSEELRRYRKRIDQADTFLDEHLAKLSSLIHEAVAILFPEPSGN